MRCSKFAFIRTSTQLCSTVVMADFSIVCFGVPSVQILT